MAYDKAGPILVVDDYATMRRVIRNLLLQLGFQNIDEATDGASALSMLVRKSYAMVISDWNMHPLDGLELLRAIRADRQLHHLPFVMITAESRPANVVAARQAGVDNYILKPFNAETLAHSIEDVLGRCVTS